MFKGILAALLGALCFCALPTAQAFGEYVPDATQLTVDTGLDFGGDKLVTVAFTDGSTKSLNAGDGVFGDVGVLHNFGSSGWGLKGTIGVKYNAISASNGTISFIRFPLDVLGIYTYGNHHFGAGLTYVMSPKTNLDGFGPDTDYNNATGLVLQYQYWLFGLRYTNLKYHVSGICFSGCSFDGSSLGFFANFVF
ncbi:MAG: hypothetical protein ACM3ZT_05765 [Bacillota bacterium]